MTDARISDAELAELVRRTKEATAAWMRGDMDRYDDRAESIRAAAGYFAGGEAELEPAEAHAWGDTVVLVMIEQQHGQVGGLPDQDWSLRVTQVYRRDGADWRVVHRHADPLVREVGLERAAAIARG